MMIKEVHYAIYPDNSVQAIFTFKDPKRRRRIEKFADIEEYRARVKELNNPKNA